MSGDLTVAVVLPPREGFGPGHAGAIGLLVQRLSGGGEVVLGRAFEGAAFGERRFEPVRLPLWPPASGVGRYANGVVRSLRRLRPQLVEVHNRPVIALAVRRALPDTPLLLVLHNDPQGMRGAADPAARRRLMAAMRVATVSGWLAERFMEGIGDAPPPAVLPNCLDLAALPTAATERAAEILFAGRIVADKGADTFVEACAAVLPALPEWRAKMIGADRFGPGSPDTPFLAGLRPRAAAAGIVLDGYRPHQAVLTAMAAAAIVAVPSRWPEPFGLVALEAMASGAALVCSGRGGLAELVGDAALIVDPDQPGALAEALRRLAADAGLRTALAACGLARARQFDVGPARGRLLEVREGLLF